MIVYLNLTGFADRIKVGRDTLAKYKLPPADAVIGDGSRGWFESTLIEHIGKEQLMDYRLPAHAIAVGGGRGWVEKVIKSCFTAEDLAKLPSVDGIFGGRRGWLESTIDTWNDARPGRGNWGPKPKTAQQIADDTGVTA